MREDCGDIWTYPAEYRCVTTNSVVRNGFLVMGKGVALQAKQRYPTLAAKLGAWVERYGNRPFLCREERIITFPTKRDWRQDSTLEIILASARLVVEIVDKFVIDSIVLPRVGCGNGNLSWNDVGPELAKMFDDRFIVVDENKISSVLSMGV